MAPRDSVLIVGLLVGAADALRLIAPSKNAVIAAAAAVSISLAPPNLPQPAWAGYPESIESAITELAQSSHPILKAQTADTFPKFTNSIGELVLKKVKPDKLGRSLDLGIDAFLSVPPEKIKALEKALQSEFADLKTDSCDLVPLPPSSLADKFRSSDAAKSVSADKWKRFDDLYGGSLAALSRTETSICLPPPESLAKLSLAQAEVGKSFGRAEAKAFGKYTGATLKTSLGLSDVMGLANDAKKLAPSATIAEKARFEKAGKTLEKAAKREAMLYASANAAEIAAEKAAEREASNAEMKATMEEASKKAKESAAERAAEKERLAAEQAKFYADLKAKREAAEAAKK